MDNYVEKQTEWKETWSQTGQSLQDHWVKELTRKILNNDNNVLNETQQSMHVGPFG